MSISGARTRITEAVTAWKNVISAPHRFGGTEYRFGKREIGHIHGNHLVDIPFPTKVRDEIVNSGQAEAHHILPDSGWISFYLRQDGDVEQAIELLRRSYQLAVQQKRKRQKS